MNGRKKLRSFDIIAMTQQSRFNYVPMSCAILTFVLHAAIIFNGEFVWDDRAAVLSNPDVLGQRSLLDLVSYDFWGQDMALEVTSTLVFDFALAHTLPNSFSLCMHYHQISHKSWRPAKVNLQYCHAALGANSEKITNSINEDVTLNLLGIISKEIGKHDDAIQYFDKGMAVNAESYDLLINIASLHTDMDNYDLAKAYFEKAENLDDLVLCHGV